ncbi:MAG: FHA domain-containing protein [Acidimicrobiales bacterium]
MSSPGPVRFAIGAGLLTVANDFVVFVSPAGPVADKWSDLAHTPAGEAEIETALRSDIPPDHHLAFLKLVDAGPALLVAPGAEPIHGSVRRSIDGAIRFGMQPAPDGFWIGSGVVGASGFEVTGFAVEGAATEAEPAATDTALPETAHQNKERPNLRPSSDTSRADPQPPKSEFFTDAPPPQPPPPPAADTPDDPVFSPEPPPTPVEPPILSSALFSDLPTESDPPTDRPLSLAIRFDDGQQVALSGPLAVGRAPEGSTDVPEGATIVVVSGDQVSRCHFVIRPCATGAEVIDTNSLNGCFLDDADRPGSGPQIPVGVPVPIEPRQRLRFGDRSFTVIHDQQDT